jgi:serine/threonine-protein kinase
VEAADAHPSPEQLEAFLSGTGGADTAAQVEVHIDRCEDCRVLLSNVVRAQGDAAARATTHQVAAAPVTPGDVIAGKYRIERVIGAGGMGTVVAAWHQQLNQPVALKFMLPAIAADPQAAARFQREARAAARLMTPHVGRVLDLDALPNGTPYLVMELLEGQTLAQHLLEVKRVEVKTALEWMQQALSALAEAHGLSIVHRDFKPANLFIAKRNDAQSIIKVLDFGIAKSVHPDIEKGLTGTSSQMLMGSPPYMAPEQVNPGKTVDARTDVWAAGVVLYELLSGETPFGGATVIDLLFAIANKTPRPLRELNPAVPPAIAQVVERCLSKDPAARHADAAALSQALSEAEKASALETAPPPAPARRVPLRPIAIALSVVLAATVTWYFARPAPLVNAPPVAEPLLVPPPAQAPAALPTLVQVVPTAAQPAGLEPARAPLERPAARKVQRSRRGAALSEDAKAAAYEERQ